MTRTALVLGIASLTLPGLVVPACVSRAQQPAAASPIPEVFAPGVLSSGQIYRGSFAPDGNTFYFFQATGGENDYRIFVSRRGRAGWSAAERLVLGGDFSDLYPAISKDGSRLVFSSYRPIPGSGTGKPNAHLWFAERRGDGWGPPVYMARASRAGHYHSWVEFGFDDRVYFRRTTPDWKQHQTLVTRWNGRDYDTPELYEAAERWKGWRADVNVVGGSPGPDANLVFLDVATRNPATGRNASDIWVAIREGDRWMDPRPLGAGINSDGFDVFPFVSPDGRDLYFVRDFTTFHRIPLREALASLPPPIGLRYVANAGVLVSLEGSDVLVDAPIREGIPPYAISDAAERDKLERARPPYERVAAILITHWHEDHFSTEAVAAHLAANGKTVLVSSPEVVERVRAVAPALPAEQLRGVLPAPGASELVRIGSLPIHVLRIRHNPTRRLPEQHVGFLFGQPAVLHTGDADPAADNFAVLRDLPPVDLALVPFWYLLTGASREFVRASLAPASIAAMHLPPTQADEVRRTFTDAGVRAALLTTPATPATLPPRQE